MIKNKDFKQYFLWPLFLLVLATSFTFLTNYFNERENKRAQLQEKKLLIISDLTESYQKLSYYTTYKDIINIEKMGHIKYIRTSENQNQNILELTIKQRMKLEDTIKSQYPIYYQKMEEAESKLFPFLKNIQLTKFFFSHPTHLKIDSLMDCFPSEKMIQNSIVSRLKDTCCISEKEKIKILVSIQKKRDDKFSNLLESMVRETK